MREYEHFRPEVQATLRCDKLTSASAIKKLL